jgi:Bacteriophage HK97-gp10, putative tail-component
MTSRVEVDTSRLTRGMRQLAAGLDRTGPRVALTQAARTAGQLRSNLPVRTGRLRASVRTTSIPDGATVSYGAGVPYAHYIEGRTHAAEHAVSGADAQFYAAMFTAARNEVRRL